MKFLNVFSVPAIAIALFCDFFPTLSLAQTNTASLIRGKLIFPAPITWTGAAAPPEAESAALLAALETFQTSPAAGIASVEQFLTVQPNSAWSPSLHANLAEYYKRIGRYSVALDHWGLAWNGVRSFPDAASQTVAARVLSHWSRLLASLGRKEDLRIIFAEASTQGIDVSGYASAIESTKDGLAMMKLNPGVSYRCGSYAMAQVIRVLKGNPQAITKLESTPSPDGGFKLSELASLSKDQGLDLVAVKRTSGSTLVVPSVVHWRLHHYAAIVERSGDSYKVIDPTFGEPRWLTDNAINSEASGYFMVPSGAVPQGWAPVGSDEALVVHGSGYPNTIDDDDDEPPPDPDDCPPNPPGAGDGSCVWDDPSGESCGDPCDQNDDNDGEGMAVWRVSEPYITLWLHDTPLFYKSSGPKVPLKLSYNHRGEPKDGHFASFGDRWECNWLEYLQQDSASTVIKAYVPGGGQRSYATNGTPEYKQGGSVSLPDSSGNAMSVHEPYGSVTKYTYTQSYAIGITNYFLADKLDRYGRGRHYTYQTVVTNGATVTRLTSVRDIDNKEVTMSYTNTAYPQLITAATDPYGRIARFIYDQHGWLTNITDMMGTNSAFQYDTTGFVTNLHTGYGNTGFRYFTSTNLITGSALNRAMEVTEPGGFRQLYAYRDNCIDNSSGSNVYLEGDYNSGDEIPYYRNSFHWNRQQFAALSAVTNYLQMSQADYWRGSLKHWLHKTVDSGFKVSGTLSTSAGPVVGPAQMRINVSAYQYYGQSSLPFTGSNAWVVSVTKSLQDDNGDYSYMEISRNAKGRPEIITKNIETGSPIYFTNTYDLDGRRLLEQRGPHGELVLGFGYADTNSYLVTSVTNAVGDVTRYTHDPNTKYVLTQTHPSGLIISNTYYSSGTYSNFLAARVEMGHATNSYSYLNGNILAHTNALGRISTNAYDNLNRLTQVLYPDGTTISNLYDKLDLVGAKDRMGYWSWFGFNNLRQLTGRTNANGAATLYQYCDCGSPSQVTSVLDTTNYITQFAYDIAGRLTNTIHPDGYTVAYVQDGIQHPQSATDNSGRVVTFNFNHYGKLREVLLTGSHLLLHHDFDDYDRVISTIDRNGVITTNSYDLVGRPLEKRSYNNSTLTGLEQFEYNSRGLTNYSDALGHVTRFLRDDEGRVRFQTNANNQSLAFTYDPVGTVLTLTDGKTNTTFWNYNENGWVTNKVDATTNEMFRYRYDADGRLTNRLQAGSITTTFRYDPMGNLTNIIYPTSSNVVFQYDLLNRLTNMVDGIGNTAFTWTPGGQLASENGPWDRDTVTYTYSGRTRASMSIQQPNASDWVQTYGYDEMWRLTNTTSQAGSFDYTYQWPSAGAYVGASDLIHYLNLPGGSYIENSQDDLGRLVSTALKQSSGTILDSHSYVYNGSSQRTRQTFPAGNYTDYTYDNIGQLVTAKGLESDGTTVRHNEQYGYAYDSAWNLSSRTNDALIQNFSVNGLNELTAGTNSGALTVIGAASESRAADPYSYGVTNVTVNAQTAELYADGAFAKSGFTVTNGNNSYTAVARDTTGRQDTDTINAYLLSSQTFSYDSRGNLISDGRRVFSYDDENQLVSVMVSNVFKSEFTYDALSRRRIRFEYSWMDGNWNLTNRVTYIYDRRSVIQERAKPVNLPAITYTRGIDLSGSLEGAGGIGGLLARTDQCASTVSKDGSHAFYFADGNGNICALINRNQGIEAKYTYDPFGCTTSQSGRLAGVNIFRFSSKEFEPSSGLISYLYRYYDPGLQRWLNRDPLDEAGGINLFGFVRNAPSINADPHGDFVFLVVAIIFLYEAIANAPGPQDETFPPYHDAPDPLDVYCAATAPAGYLLGAAADAADVPPLGILRGPKGGKKHTPGRDHNSKSGAEKQKRFQREAERSRIQKAQDLEKDWDVWNKLSDPAKKLRPELKPTRPDPRCK